MSRIPLITKHEDMPENAQHFFDRIVRTRGCVAGPFQVLLHSPDMADRLSTVGEYLLYNAVLSAPVKTLTWLIAAREYDCDFAWDACFPYAKEAGIQDSIIDAIRDRKPLVGLSQEQKLLTEFCYQLLKGNHHVSDTLYRETVDHFGIAATVQIAATIGYFLMLAFLANTFEIAAHGDEAELPL